ncbi:MAG: sodium:proton antiporter [Polyangiaceae bacterium]|jgi:Na+/H+ antiporter NhaD/arsenite permease-like protein|nr:sodium:proton antiporter [Polyangiaceae bacterium]
MTVPWWGVLPFAMLLGCIATFPLMPMTKKLWHHTWFQLVVALLFGVPMGIWMWFAGNHHGVVHALVEYAQFITLLLSLYVVSGGIFVSGDIRATSRNNVIFLAIGGALASFIGTTGAAMLMIRPLLNINAERQNKVHTVVFAIFVVANCGGLLTPLGDPPLFLGMLRGVPFLWTMSLLPEWLFVNGLLLLGYYALDRKLYALEPPAAILADNTQIEPIGIKGKLGFVWLALIVACVATVPSVDLHAIFEGHAHWTNYMPFREIGMLTVGAISLLGGNKQVRFENNKFSWGPILEVAALFIGIFLAMIPALKYLAQVAPTLPLNEVTFFAFAGGLSSVLDNAPTYVTFFEMARELPGPERIGFAPGVPQLYLVSISLGAVFCGAVTYIGNGPNFMVKSIAESAHVEMPSFGAYTFKWAFRYLLPVLLMMVLIFIVQDWRVRVIGVLMALVRVAHDIWQASRYHDPHARVATPMQVSRR